MDTTAEMLAGLGFIFPPYSCALRRECFSHLTRSATDVTHTLTRERVWPNLCYSGPPRSKFVHPGGTPRNQIRTHSFFADFKTLKTGPCCGNQLCSFTRGISIANSYTQDCPYQVKGRSHASPSPLAPEQSGGHERR